MRRWHSTGDQRVMHARKRYELNSGNTRENMVSLGWWRWRHPLDCSKTRCAVCHFEKFHVPKARQRKKQEAIDFELSL